MHKKYSMFVKCDCSAWNFHTPNTTELWRFNFETGFVKISESKRPNQLMGVVNACYLPSFDSSDFTNKHISLPTWYHHIPRYYTLYVVGRLNMA